jgi:hypothetical protein
MRKSLILTLFLALAAVPAFAQQSEADVQAPTATLAVAAEAGAVQAPDAERAPTIHVTTEEIREAVRANEKELAGEQAITDSGTWLTVAVIAAAVAVALILLR